jgi:hypothetical protein
MTTPTLPAYRVGGQLWVWCAHEQRWHYHGAVSPAPGAGNGERASHCACPASPLSGRYSLVEVGPLTPAIRRAHRAVRRPHRCSVGAAA